jgi:GNAT superfamily N-acetyltransferase
VLRIRPANANDIPLIVQLVRELAEYEKLSEQAVASEGDIRRDGFSANPKFRVVIAEWGDEAAGFALFFYNYSTWVGRPGLYLEDLFVRPEFRRNGIGRALLTHLARVAVEEGCGRFEWQVLNWNAPAIEFYKSLGARVMEEWSTVRISGEPLRKLASPDKS